MTMRVAVTIDIQALIDERPLSRLQKPGPLLSAGFVGLCIGALAVPAACAGLSILGQERASG